jgi:hypothetical protein
MGELTQLLEAGGWDFGQVEVISAQVEILQGIQLENHLIEVATLQATVTQIKPCHPAAVGAAAAANACPPAAILAGVP